MVTEKIKDNKSSEYEDCYGEIFYNNHTVMMLIDPVNFNILDANPAASNFYGYDHEELINMKISEINISDNNYVFEEMQKAVSKQKNNFIFKHQLANGEIRDVNVCSSVINHKGKTLLHSIISDITEQRKAVKELRESENRYHTLFATMFEGFAFCKMIYDNNNQPIDWIYIDVNRAFERLTGLKNIKGKKVTEAIPGIKESNPDLFRIYNQVVLTGKPTIFEIDFKPLNIWLNISVYSPQNKHFVAIFEDITERKNFELDLIELKNNLELEVKNRTIELEESYKFLKESEEHYQTLLNSIDEGFCTIEVIFDANNKPIDYRFLEINPAFEMQIGMIKAEGKLDHRLAPYNEEILFETYGKIVLTGLPKRFIYEAKEFNKWYDVYAFKVNNKKREVAILFSDITKFKEVETKLMEYQDTLEEKVIKRTEELKRSNTELANFAHIASHDLREPLRMISSFLQLLERRYEDQLDQDAKEFIGYAVDGAKRLNDMIIDLLKYSKLTNNEPVFSDVKLEKVLEDALINLLIPIKETDTIITYDPLPIVNGDDKLLTMLFQNLIGNGIKYHGSKQPKIHVSATKEDNQYIISVKDNGIGIKPEYLERIFTIFQRLHGPDEYSGTGIGLAISKKIIHKHHGEIGVESEFGKGTTFYFTLPNRNY
jgi:PAS domain S-box-containing protein